MKVEAVVGKTIPQPTQALMMFISPDSQAWQDTLLHAKSDDAPAHVKWAAANGVILRENATFKLNPMYEQEILVVNKPETPLNELIGTGLRVANHAEFKRVCIFEMFRYEKTDGRLALLSMLECVNSALRLHPMVQDNCISSVVVVDPNVELTLKLREILRIW